MATLDNFTKNTPKETNLSLSKFKSQITDYARPNRFMVNVYVPPIILGKFNLKDQEFIQWTAQTAQIPSRGQGDVGIKYHGMELKLVGDYVKENLSITFLNDYGFVGRDLFELWLDVGSQQIKTDNTKTQSIHAFDAMIYINQIGRMDKLIKTYKFYDVMPQKISSIDLDQSSNDQIEKFTVDFGYSYYENINTTN